MLEVSTTQGKAGNVFVILAINQFISLVGLIIKVRVSVQSKKLKLSVAMKTVVILLVTVTVATTTASASNGPADGPRVCIKDTINGHRFPIHVHLNGTIGHVKETIWRLSGDELSPDNQEFRFNGQILEDNLTLEDYNIGYHSHLELSYSAQVDQIKFEPIRGPCGVRRGSGKPATIYFSTPGTVGFGIDVDLTDTIEVVKEKIHHQEEYSIESQKLFFHSVSVLSQMNNKRTLLDYRVVDGTELVLRIPVGWCYII